MARIRSEHQLIADLFFDDTFFLAIMQPSLEKPSQEPLIILKSEIPNHENTKLMHHFINCNLVSTFFFITQESRGIIRKIQTKSCQIYWFCKKNICNNRGLNSQKNCITIEFTILKNFSPRLKNMKRMLRSRKTF